MVRKASSVFAEVELLEKLRIEQEKRQRTERSVSILGQVSRDTYTAKFYPRAVISSWQLTGNYGQLLQ